MKPILILGKGFIGSSLFNHFNNSKVDCELYSKSMLDYTDIGTFNAFLKDKKDKYTDQPMIITMSEKELISNMDKKHEEGGQVSTYKKANWRFW